MTHQERVNLVANGVYRIFRATDDEMPQHGELGEEDKVVIRDISEGLVKIWDGLNATERELPTP